jgi:hypothetical protein
MEKGLVFSHQNKKKEEKRCNYEAEKEEGP